MIDQISYVLGFLIFVIIIVLLIIQIITWFIKAKIIKARDKLKIKQPLVDYKLYNLFLMQASLTEKEIAKFPKELKDSFRTARTLDFVRVILFIILIILIITIFLLKFI